MIEEEYFSDSTHQINSEIKAYKSPLKKDNQISSKSLKNSNINSLLLQQKTFENPQQQQIQSQTTIPSNQKKLKYLSKQERERLKDQEKQQNLKQEQEKQKQEQKIREEYESFRYKDWKREQEREERRKKREQDEKEELQRRLKEKKSKSRSRSRSKSKDKDSKYMTSNTRAIEKIAILNSNEDPETQNIKIQYLGLNKQKKKILKPSEKFKNIFNFKWDSRDDTSVDYNPLYKNRMETNLLFGRGILAGYDVKEQLENKVKYEDLIHKYDPEYQKKKSKDEKIIKKSIYDISLKDHWSLKQTMEMTERDWRIFREDNDIIIKGGKVPRPIRRWEEGDLPPYILDSIRRLKYEKPTPIQMQTIPIGMLRKDLIGISPTGSGKSCAFLIPLIVYLRSLPPMDEEVAKDGPYALILIPTRELAPQIEKEFQNLTTNMRLKSLVMVGGRDEGNQAYKLKVGCELLIGTTGRIKDALQKNYLVLDQVSWVVLDEADKMIDMGFEADVNFILDRIKSHMKSEDELMADLQEKEAKAGEKIYRVTHLFSATMPPEIEKLAKKYLRSFCYISIGEPGGGKKDIEQIVEFIAEGQKKSRLQNILKDQKPPIIIFANEKNAVEKLQKILEKWGWNSVIYHGGRTQQQREAAVDGFKKGKYDILVATDLGSRGLHVDGVKMVINFDAPKNIKDFVHRTGRTGRAGKRGIAYTFLTNNNEIIFYDLKEFLIKNNYDVPQELDQHPASQTKPGTVLEMVPRSKQVLYAQ